VLIVERDATYAQASTSLSAASVRQQFSTPVNIAISRFGVEMIRRFPEWVGEDAPDLAFREHGYLICTGTGGDLAMSGRAELQTAHGAATEVLKSDALATRFPWLETGDLAGATFGARDEGWFDAAGLMQGFLRAARRDGAARIEAEVVDFERTGDRISGVVLGDGRRIACGAVVNAAGTRAADVAARAGVSLPVEPRKRHCFVFSCPDAIPGAMPLVTDASGIWVRPEGARFLCGAAADPDERVDVEDFRTDHDVWDTILWPALAHRIPQFERARVEGWWTGHYAMNMLDRNAIVGVHPACPNLYLANGFSGHGLQQAPAVGRGVAELIVHGRYTTLDLSALGPERLVTGTPLREAAII